MQRAAGTAEALLVTRDNQRCRHDIERQYGIAFRAAQRELVGGLAFRYRLYSRLGLSSEVIACVLGLSLATNWLGYLVLAGLVFAAGVIAPPDGFRLGAASLRAPGVVLLGALLAYRALYYLAPLAVAILVYVLMEGRSARLQPEGVRL